MTEKRKPTISEIIIDYNNTTRELWDQFWREGPWMLVPIITAVAWFISALDAFRDSSGQ